ncbi:hypothetical protein M413DRAFT_448784 [Hebeloma cylindrosporum]|uniref:Uncharacterized protein n=1 Tax=Hebeloma cylindrosporum TaxID=76867 RepID=A0A0C2Y7W3_HEBCY|nr:hypothetical protein M413DRAFT_448784 [Hebeloma cylindrosporum h7]
MMAPDDNPIQRLLIDTAHSPSEFNKLPTETMVEIFHNCLPTSPLDQRQPDTTIAPMLLCHVSSIWRSIAMSTPSLWISLNYAWGEIFDSQIYWPIESPFLKWWTANLQSAHGMVHLELDGFRGEGRYQTMVVELDSDAKSDDNDMVFEPLVGNAQGLYLGRTIIVPLWSHFSEHHLNCPNLQSLFIDQEQISVNQMTELRLTNDLDAIPIRFSKNLKRFIRHGDFFLVPLHPQIQDHIPWAQLTHVSIRTLMLTVTGWYTFIRCLLSLQFGDFHTTQMFTPPQSPFDFGTSQPHVCLDHVKTLNLCIKQNTLEFNPLQNLSLPNLTRLVIYIKDTTLDAVSSIFQSCPRLQDLRLALVYIRMDSPSSTSTTRLWDCVPELQRLTVDVNRVIYSLDPAAAIIVMQGWINSLSSRWLCLECPPESFRRLSFTALGGEDELSALQSGIQRHCSLLGLPTWVEVDVHKTVDSEWNILATELRSWM